jgi:DNA repair ATPase RecN
MLKELHLKPVSPASQFDVEFADRLNIFTGDNGLGKTFLLDIIWWLLTKNWADEPVLPQSYEVKEGIIDCDLIYPKDASPKRFLTILT